MENQIKDNAGTPSVESLVKRGCLFLEDSEWNKADEYFDKALDINPEHAPAYVGKLCVELMVQREDSLGDYKELRQGKKIDRPLGEYGNFQKALRFADDSYKKKLNGYDQKIKESLPKIPKGFTDEFINGEIARLEKEIANCDAEIVKGEKDANDAQLCVQRNQNDKKKFADIYWNSASIDGDYEGARKAIQNDTTIQIFEKAVNDWNNKAEKARQRVKEYKDKKAEYEAKKQNIEPLADISCLDRMDVHYSRFVEAMKKEATENEYKYYAEQFSSLEGYKDSAELAEKCGKLVIKVQYNKLIQEKNNTTQEEKYRELSKQFRKFGSYENSVQLADECNKLAEECVKQKEREKKARYDNLVKEKNSASTEDKYRQLTQDFREMGNYENAVQLASECDKQMNILKKQREERERQEQVRIAAREAEEQAEREKQRRYEEERERGKKRAKNIRGLMFTFVPFIVGLVLYYINDERTGVLISSLIFLGGPLVILHLRDDWDWGGGRVASIVIFWIAILPLTFAFSNYLGSLFMVAAFIIAIKYPKREYWN